MRCGGYVVTNMQQ